MLQIGVHMLHAFKYLFSRDNSVPLFLERIGLTEKYYMAHNMKKHAVTSVLIQNIRTLFFEFALLGQIINGCISKIHVQAE